MNLFTANKLTALRKHNGLSQESLAEKIGVSRQAVSKWERGEASPDTENILALSKLYCVSLDDILGDKTAEEIIRDQEIITAPAENENALYSTKKSEPKEAAEQNKQLAEILKNEMKDLPAFGKKLLKFPFFLVAIIGYLAIGFSIKVWHPTWLIFLTIPAYYITALAFLQKTEKKMLLTLPVYLYAVIIFLVIGLLLNLWHPAWLIFLCIPLYYWLVLTKK
ncbi:MAG: helix-turn-helix domain-containing protein [Clostridia bacterium]|nr:helix-turn-helix domain-containing protein [Clostridia bacterium]